MEKYGIFNIRIKCEKDVVYANKVVAKSNRLRYVTVEDEKYLELLDPNINICIPPGLVFNPILAKFKKISLIEHPAMNINDIERIDQEVLKKTKTIVFLTHKASDLLKIGYVPGVYITPEHDFEFDIDLTGMKFSHVSFCHADEHIVKRFMEYDLELDAIEVLIEHIGLVPDTAKVDLVFIQNSNLIEKDDHIYDAQNLAQNPNITTLVCYYNISGDFGHNYTLLEYGGKDQYIRDIADRNQEYLHETRFVKVRPILAGE